MSGYRLRKIVYESVDIPETDLMTIAEAARALNMTSPGIVRAVERGKLQAAVDLGKPARGGSMRILKADVERWKRERDR